MTEKRAKAKSHQGKSTLQKKSTHQKEEVSLFNNPLINSIKSSKLVKRDNFKKIK
jgi:hypothetical protein